jgi:hypothetical protein
MKAKAILSTLRLPAAFLGWVLCMALAYHAGYRQGGNAERCYWNIDDETPAEQLNIVGQSYRKVVTAHRDISEHPLDSSKDGLLHSPPGGVNSIVPPQTH